MYSVCRVRKCYLIFGAVGRVTTLERWGALRAIVLAGRLTDPCAQRREADGPRAPDTTVRSAKSGNTVFLLISPDHHMAMAAAIEGPTDAAVYSYQRKASSKHTSLP